MSFLLKTPEPFYHSMDNYKDTLGIPHVISRWKVSTAYGGSFTLTRGNAARIIWERNPDG